MINKLIYKNENLKNRTLGCKVSDDEYKEFDAEAKQEGLNRSDLMRKKLFGPSTGQDTVTPREDATPKPKPKRKRYPVDANNSVLEQISPRVFESPDISLLIKPYPPDCNPINYDTPGEKIGALVRRMQCLNLRAMMVQRSRRPKL